MSEAVTETQTVSNEAIAAETERLLAVAATRNHLNIDDVRAQYLEVAKEQAIKNLEEEAKRGTSYKALYEAERKKREDAENVLAAIREQGQKHGAPTGPSPSVVVAQAKAKAGEFEWNHRLSNDQKISALGIDPKSVSVKEAQKVFGRGADHKLASDLHKADPAKYRTLKQVAIALGVYAA